MKLKPLGLSDWTDVLFPPTLDPHKKVEIHISPLTLSLSLFYSQFNTSRRPENILLEKDLAWSCWRKKKHTKKTYSASFGPSLSLQKWPPRCTGQKKNLIIKKMSWLQFQLHTAAGSARRPGRQTSCGPNYFFTSPSLRLADCTMPAHGHIPQRCFIKRLHSSQHPVVQQELRLGVSFSLLLSSAWQPNAVSPNRRGARRQPTPPPQVIGSPAITSSSLGGGGNSSSLQSKALKTVQKELRR